MAEPRHAPGAPPRSVPWLRLVITVPLTVALIVVLLRQLEGITVEEAVRRADSASLLLAGALYAVMYGLRAVRVGLLLPAGRFSTWYGVVCLHALLVRVLPLRLGELSFAFLLKRHAGVQLSAGFAGLFYLRLLDGTTVLAFLAAGLLWVPLHSAQAGEQAVGISAALALLAAAFVYTTPSVVPLMHRWLRARNGRHGHAAAAGVVRRMLLGLEEALAWASRVTRRRLIQLSLVTVVHWSLNFVIIFIMVRGLGVMVSPGQALWGGTATAVGSFLPLAAVGTLGTLEAGWTAGFAAAGVSLPEAAASALGYSAVTFAYSGVLAGAGGLALKLSGRAAGPAPSDP